MLKVSKTNSESKFKHFKDDNEFCQFAIDPNLVINTDRCVIDGKNIASYDFKFTDSYNKAIEDGTLFVIDDKKSLINKRGAVTIKLITKPIENLYVNYD